jgi:hypothetical protein
LVVAGLVVFLTPSHYEIEFAKYICGVSLLGCLAVWVCILGLMTAGLWAWITDIIGKRRNRKVKKGPSGETLTG